MAQFFKTARKIKIVIRFGKDNYHKVFLEPTD
jgi:hypothetical protein